MAKVNIEQNGSDIEIALGGSLELELPENPSTGYRWQIRCDGRPKLKLERDWFEPSLQAFGARGIHYWSFQALQQGATQLEVALRRSWEPRVTQTFRVVVRIEVR